MPCDRLAFAILVGGEVELAGIAQRGTQFGDGLLLLRADYIVRLEPVVHIHAELAELRLLVRRHLAWLCEVANMAHRRQNGVAVPEIPADLLRLGGRLHYDELAAGGHDRSPYFP